MFNSIMHLLKSKIHMQLFHYYYYIGCINNIFYKFILIAMSAEFLAEIQTDFNIKYYA